MLEPCVQVGAVARAGEVWEAKADYRKAGGVAGLGELPGH